MSEFVSYLIGEGKSPETRRKYTYAVETFAEFLRHKSWWPPQRAPRGALREFVTYLAVEKHWSKSAVRQATSGTRKWLDWLQGQPEGDGLPEFLRAATPKPDRRLPVVLSGDQMAVFLALAASAEQPYRTALMLAPFCGLRINELVSLRLGSIDASRRGGDGKPRLVLRTLGKGNKWRLVPVLSTINRTLLAYVTGWRREFTAARKDDRALSEQNRWLFPAPRAFRYHHVSRDSMESLVKQMRPRVGIDDLKPHTMRATYLTALLTLGVPIHEVARYAGHSSVQVLFDHYAALHIEGAADIFGDIARLT